MTQKSSNEALAQRPERGNEAAESMDEEWFATGERASTPPPRSTRRPLTAPSAPPADPIGDTVADDWFR
jgi:hypothetical protein